MKATLLDTPDPRYVQVAEALEQLVEALGARRLLPTEQQLAARFGVSRVTVRRALGMLEDGGKITRERGRGTIVSATKLVRHLVPPVAIEEDFRNQGAKLETAVVRYCRECDPPENVRERLSLKSGLSAGFLRLVRRVDDEVICCDDRYLPPKVAKRFDPSMLDGRPVSEILQTLGGGEIDFSTVEAEIAPAPRETARLLGIKLGMLVALYTFTEYCATGAPLQTGLMSYRIDRVKFRIVLEGAPFAKDAAAAANWTLRRRAGTESSPTEGTTSLGSPTASRRDRSGTGSKR